MANKHMTKDEFLEALRQKGINNFEEFVEKLRGLQKALRPEVG